MRAARKRRSRRAIYLAVFFIGLAVLAGCGTENGQNSLKPHGPAARKIDDLFRWPVGIAAVVFVLVIGALFVAVFRFRERPGNENPKQVHGNMVLEISWTIIPAVILVGLSIPTAVLIHDLAQTPKNAIEVTAIGKQWWWEFSYPAGAANKKDPIVTSTELHIPVGVPVNVDATACEYDNAGKLIGSSCNVIHSFWVPELNGKADAVPGRHHYLTIQADSVGVYLGQCAEFCGLSHANMRFRVIAESQADYDAWLKSQQQPTLHPLLTKDNKPTSQAAELIQKFQCANCHNFNTTSAYSYGPVLTHLAQRSHFAGGTLQLTQANLAAWVYNAPSFVPMQSDGCRLPVPATCVGMPNFSKNLKGYPTMTKSEANTIADYLLSLK
jgi:cytochrome c oxidase subunit 2